MREKCEQSWLPKLLPRGRDGARLAWGLLQWGWTGQGGEDMAGGLWGFPSRIAPVSREKGVRGELGGVRLFLPNLGIPGTPCHILPRLRLDSAFFG